MSCSFYEQVSEEQLVPEERCLAFTLIATNFGLFFSLSNMLLFMLVIIIMSHELNTLLLQ